MLCHTISVQCYGEFTMDSYQYKFYFIRFIILIDKETLTETGDVICKSGITPDATSGKENLLKNFI